MNNRRRLASSMQKYGASISFSLLSRFRYRGETGGLPLTRVSG
jgi:hypothetical protein